MLNEPGLPLTYYRCSIFKTTVLFPLCHHTSTLNVCHPLEVWLRCRDELNACSDNWHDSHSHILPLSGPSGMFDGYQHIFTLLEVDSDLSGQSYRNQHDI